MLSDDLDALEHSDQDQLDIDGNDAQVDDNEYEDIKPLQELTSTSPSRQPSTQIISLDESKPMKSSQDKRKSFRDNNNTQNSKLLLENSKLSLDKIVSNAVSDSLTVAVLQLNELDRLKRKKASLMRQSSLARSVLSKSHSSLRGIESMIVI